MWFYYTVQVPAKKFFTASFWRVPGGGRSYGLSSVVYNGSVQERPFSFFKIFKPHLSRCRKKVLLLAAAAVALLVVVVLAAYHLAYWQRIYPRLYLQDLALTGLTKAEAEAAIDKYVGSYQDEVLAFTYGDQTFRFTQTELGFRYDPVATANRAYAYARSGPFWQNWRLKIAGWDSGVFISPDFETDESHWQAVVSRLAQEIDHPVTEPSFTLKDGQLGVTLPASGQVLAVQEWGERVRAKVASFSFAEEALPVTKLEPRLSREDFLQVQGQVLALLSSPLKLVSEEKTWELTPEELLAFLVVEKATPFSGPLQVSRLRLGEYIKKMAQEVYQAPKGEIFRLQGDKVLEFSPSIVGQELAEDQLMELLGAALLNPRREAELSLPLKEVRAAPGDQNTYGIQELLGEGMTNWGRSSANRIYNIVLASKKLSGTLIPPQGIFSLGETVGEVSEETGYKKEYVIKKGETVLDAGGGLCQVSTTVFRSALYSGLPIVERLPHAYRVGYYEPPLGFDATVYPPTVDLKFKNDTSAHLLLWASWDEKKGELVFRLYGTSDGRQVKFEGPFNKDYVTPPEPLYIDDPNLPKGEIKQKEREITGVTTEFSRVISWPDGREEKETFKSKYQPWQAVFLVGTRE